MRGPSHTYVITASKSLAWLIHECHSDNIRKPTLQVIAYLKVQLVRAPLNILKEKIQSSLKERILLKFEFIGTCKNKRRLQQHLLNENIIWLQNELPNFPVLLCLPHYIGHCLWKWKSFSSLHSSFITICGYLINVCFPFQNMYSLSSMLPNTEEPDFY